MAGCLSCGDGGNVSPENVRRWTERLLNVLCSSTARQRFHDFLESRELEQGQKLLQFWEKCDKFLVEAEKSKHHTRGWRKSPEKKPRSSTGYKMTDEGHHKTTLKKEAQLLVEFADSDINFDPAQMQVLYTALESSDKTVITKAISEAKQNAAELLEDEGYHEFCQYLLKKQGLLKETD